MDDWVWRCTHCGCRHRNDECVRCRRCKNDRWTSPAASLHDNSGSPCAPAIVGKGEDTDKKNEDTKKEQIKDIVSQQRQLDKALESSRKVRHLPGISRLRPRRQVWRGGPGRHSSA